MKNVILTFYLTLLAFSRNSVIILHYSTFISRSSAFTVYLTILFSVYLGNLRLYLTIMRLFLTTAFISHNSAFTVYLAILRFYISQFCVSSLSCNSVF